MGSQFALRASGEGGGFNDAKMKESLFARARAAAEAGRSDLQRLISDGVCLGGREGSPPCVSFPCWLGCLPTAS